MVEPEPEPEPLASQLTRERAMPAATVSLVVSAGLPSLVPRCLAQQQPLCHRLPLSFTALDSLQSVAPNPTSRFAVSYARVFVAAAESAGQLDWGDPGRLHVGGEPPVENIMGRESDRLRSELEAAQAELRSMAQVSERTAAELERAQAQLDEERMRHERSTRESEESRVRLSEQLSASLSDLALAHDGTQALVEEMKQWNHFKAVVTCQRVVRRRKDARQFRFLLREAVRHQRETNALKASLQESRQHAKELEAQSKAELESMHAACLDHQTKLSAAEAQARMNSDLAAQAAIDTAAVRRQLENALHSSSMSEARGTDELSTLRMKLSAAQAEAKSNAEAAVRASADAQSAWSASAEARTHWEQIQTESDVARTELQGELQRSAATHAAQIAELRMQIATVEASARSEIQAAASNQESALCGELSAARAASFAAETALKQKTEEVAQLRLESKEALRTFANAEAARVSVTEERDIHEQARRDAEAKCLEMESSFMQEKATMQSLLSAVEMKLTDADRRMSLITEQALQNVADRETETRRIQETMDHRLVRASLRRLRQCTLAKAISTWQTWASGRALTRHKMRKVLLRIQNLILASALYGWRESVARAIRLRTVCEKAIKRTQNISKALAFTALWDYRSMKKQRLLDQQDRGLVIDEMHDLMHARAVAICQRAVRRKQDATRLKILAKETGALRLQVAQLERAASEADAVYASQLSEATANLQAQLVEQEECFRIEVREMQKSLVDAERALVEKQQFEDTAQQLQAQSAAESLKMQEDLLAQAEALIADKEKLNQREAVVMRRESEVSPTFAEIDSIKEALANERAERAKDRVARQRLEEQSRKQVAREVDLTRQVRALQRRVQEQQRLLARLQGKKAAIGSSPRSQPADSHTDGQQNALRSPTRPRVGSPQKRQVGTTGGVHAAQKNSTPSDAADQPQSSWVGPYRPHEARSPLPAEERKAQGKAMLWSHGTTAARSKSTPRSAADQPQSSWVGPYRPHEARSPLPAEERKAQGKAMLWSHGTAAARAAAAAAKDKSLQNSGTRKEIHALSSMLEAQVHVLTEVESDHQATEAERLAATEEAAAARTEAVAVLKQGVRLDMFFATGKLKHGRFFWLGPAGPSAGQATLSWGKVAHAAARSSKTEILRSVTDGPSLAAPGELFDALDKDRNGSLDASEVSALYRQARGEKLSKKALAKALGDMDTDGSGTVGRDEFLQWWSANAASDLEKQRDRSLTIELGDASNGAASDDGMLLRLVAPTVKSKDQILLGLTVVLGGLAV